MGHWDIDGDSSPGVLRMRLSGSLSTAEIAEFVRAHNRAIDALGEADYRVFVDLRALLPLSPEAESLEKITQLSIAPLISRAIKEVFEDGSVTSMFEGRA